MKKKNKGFTLIEMLVVVLIIGILAGIALPQYQIAVTKAKVASILPLMRRWKDALQEYKLQHGSYDDLEYSTGAATLGVNWPSDWNDGNCGDRIECENEYWSCSANEFRGSVYCLHDFNDGFILIFMHNSDILDEDVAGLTTCEGEEDTEAEKVCKALGGKALGNVSLWGNSFIVYKLN